jgi:hypothetical protein
MPARNAPTAAEMLSASVPPAVSSTRLRIPSRRASSEWLNTARLSAGPYRAAPASTATTTTNERVIDTATVPGPPPTSSTVMTGRNAAMTRSSNTRIAKTSGVSRLPIHCRSWSVRAITPEDEM